MIDSKIGVMFDQLSVTVDDHVPEMNLNRVCRVYIELTPSASSVNGSTTGGLESFSGLLLSIIFLRIVGAVYDQSDILNSVFTMPRNGISSVTRAKRFSLIGINSRYMVSLQNKKAYCYKCK